MDLMDMTLEEFLLGERQRLERFEAWWRAHQTVQPEYFPASMPAGEWDEQLQTFDPVLECAA